MDIDDIKWNGLPDRADLGNTVNVVWDADISGFRPLKTTDMHSYLIFSSGVQITGSIVTGQLYTANILQVGGIAVSNTGYYPGVAEGSAMPLAFDKDNGGLRVTQADLNKDTDEVTAYLPRATVVAGSNVLDDNVALAMPYNQERLGFFIQNVGTGKMFINFGNATPSTTNFSMILKGGAEELDGLGASYSEVPATYIGPVYVSGNGIKYVAWEM